jgi:hypothetical protein
MQCLQLSKPIAERRWRRSTHECHCQQARGLMAPYQPLMQPIRGSTALRASMNLRDICEIGAERVMRSNLTVGEIWDGRVPYCTVLYSRPLRPVSEPRRGSELTTYPRPRPPFGSRFDVQQTPVKPTRSRLPTAPNPNRASSPLCVAFLRAPGNCGVCGLCTHDRSGNE